MMNRASGARELRGDTPGLDTLTPAERRILKLIATEMTSKEIAADLGLSLRTIENHRSNTCSKLGIRGSNIPPANYDTIQSPPYGSRPRPQMAYGTSGPVGPRGGPGQRRPPDQQPWAPTGNTAASASPTPSATTNAPS